MRRLSVRLKLTFAFTGFLLVAGLLMLALVWLYLVPRIPRRGAPGAPGRPFLVENLLPVTAIAVFFLLAFGLGGGWFLAGRLLAPLDRITDAARRVGGGSLAHRIRMRDRQDEFRELADAFDAMLEQLDSHVAEQRRFAANASHELRTPLAISRTLLDVARQDPAGDRTEVIERLWTVNTRAIGLTEALLLLSRSDGGAFTREAVDLSLLAEEAAETLLPLAERRGITLEVTGGAAVAGGSPELLLRMVTNLLQNAIVHNRPVDGTVSVSTASEGDRAVLRLENTGPLVAAATVPALTEPFHRGAARVRTDEHAGAGLGLAIVQSIVRAHDGVLELTPRPLGGLLVTVRLPG